MSYNLEFDAQTHTYSVEGRVVPSVTQILKNTGFIDDRFFTPEATQRGTRVHEASQLVDAGSLDWFSVSDEDQPYLRAYEAFITESGFKAEFTEKRLYCRMYNFAGTPDRAGKFDENELAIIDLKTGAKQKWWFLQLAAYQHLLRMRDPKYAAAACYSLELKDNGKYNLVRHYVHSELQIFLAAATIENYKSRIK